MLALARFRLPDGSVETLCSGDFVGRIWSAALRIDDPDVSEAHALLSLRGERLWLLALRRRLMVDGKATDAVPLTVGLRIRLTPTIEIVVDDLRVPDSILGLEGPDLLAQALPGTCALVFDPHPRLAAGATPDGAAVFWSTGDEWRVRPPGEPARALVEGDTIALRGHTFRAVPIALSTAGQTPTRADPSGPIRVVARYDTVHIHRADGEVVVVTGQLARVVSELVAVRQPLAWEELARPHWPHLDDRDLLRRRWDGLLVRLRERLRGGGVRPDLVSSTRIGLVELILRDGDTAEDLT